MSVLCFIRAEDCGLVTQLTTPSERNAKKTSGESAGNRIETALICYPATFTWATSSHSNKLE